MRWMSLALSIVPAGLSAQNADFERCLAAIRASAQGQRLAAATWERYARGLQPDPRVITQQQAQPEFTLPIWDYIAVMVDDERIASGRRLMVEYSATLEAIERQYRVDPAVVVAIWGIESDFGRATGSFEVLRSLATLSCHGRRQSYFRGEFLAALRAVQNGEIDGDRYLGSWAGAFGQEMARTFITRRVDVPNSSRALAWDTMLTTSSCGTRMSPRAFGHTGFTGTSLWIDPDRGLYVVLLTNRVYGDGPEDGTADGIAGVRRAFHDAVIDAWLAR